MVATGQVLYFFSARTERIFAPRSSSSPDETVLFPPLYGNPIMNLQPVDTRAPDTKVLAKGRTHYTSVINIDANIMQPYNTFNELSPKLVLKPFQNVSTLPVRSGLTFSSPAELSLSKSIRVFVDNVWPQPYGRSQYTCRMTASTSDIFLPTHGV